MLVLSHGHGGSNGLEEGDFINAGEDEASLVQCLGTLGGGADAHCREGLTYGSKEGAFLGESTAVGNHSKGVHLQTVVVVEAQRLVTDHAGIQSESGGFQTVAGTGVAGIQDGHIVGFCQLVDGGEKTVEVLLRIDILFPMGGQKDVLPFCEPKACVDVAGHDGVQILVENLGHGRTCDIGALFGQSALVEIATCVLGVCQINIGNDIHDTAVGLLGEALVLAAVAGLHVENGNVEALGGDGGQTGIGIAKNQQSVGLDLVHQLVGAVDDVAHGSTQVVAHSVHVHLGVGQSKILEEDAVEVVIVVLPRVGENSVKIGTAFLDHGGKADDFRTGAHDDEKLQLAVVLEGYVGIVKF